MLKPLALGLALLGSATMAHAANVGVVDSGTDFSHEFLKDAAFVNPGEIAGDMIDNDKNGKVDDVNGWNFVDNAGQVFFPDHLKEIDPMDYQYLRVIAHKQGSITTPAEEQFYDSHVTKLTKDQKAALMNQLEFFGTMVHSTHVSGIIHQLSPGSKIMSARVFPDTPPDPYTDPNPGNSLMNVRALLSPIDLIYKLLALASNGVFAQVGSYLNEMHMDVANYSLGMSIPTLAKESLILRGNKNPTPEQIAAESQRMFAQYGPEGAKWMAAAPKTLFVVAAGNDGTDNDVLPAFPANIRVENEISVAASQGYRDLATFSNYGKTMVDVAAPGVSIVSSVPSLDHKTMLPLSGTSMASPFVAGVAAAVKDGNPGLTPADIKRILMTTVDVKDWLKGKVVSSGVVNADRASRAAVLSKEMSVDDACSRARTEVADQSVDTHGAQILNVGHSSPDLEDAAPGSCFLKPSKKKAKARLLKGAGFCFLGQGGSLRGI